MRQAFSSTLVALTLLTSTILFGTENAFAGQVYSWKAWTVASGSLSASASVSNGTVTLSTTSPNSVSNFGVTFDNVQFTPTVAPGAGASTPGPGGWSCDLAFSAGTSTTGVIIGIGNLGHGVGYSTYTLSGITTSNTALGLNTLGQLGAFDDEWPAFPLYFNDTLSLNTFTGALVVTTVPTENDANSNMLLLRLPAGVATLTIATAGASGGDTINILAADAQEVGDPVCPSHGSPYPCPCANFGVPTHGCENSASMGGALLWATGGTTPDTVVLDVVGLPQITTGLIVQGTAPIFPIPFGDGVRCVGGLLTRLYVETAVNGHLYAPHSGQPSITSQSAMHNDTIPASGTRYYFAWYRDPPSFCTPAAFNVSNSISIQWL